MLFGTHVSSADCPTTAIHAGDLAIRPVTGVNALVLCQYPRYPHKKDLTLRSGDPRLDAAIALLSRPSQHTSAAAPCPASAEIPVVILAVTASGVFLVRPPTGACGNYLTPLPEPA